jgi:hypothetical protein
MSDNNDSGNGGGAFLFNLPVIDSVNQGQVNGIIDNQMSLTGTALAALNSYVGTMVNYATAAINIPIPAAMAEGLNFDFSMAAFNDLLNRKPLAPTVEDITVNFPIAPVINLPNIQAIALSNLWNQIYQNLNDDIVNGGYGININDEIAMWERAKERELADLSAQYDEADELYAGAGYKFPPGALLKVKQKAKETYQAKTATLNRDQTIERAKLFVEARQFALEKGVDFGKLFIDIGNLQVSLYDSDIKGALGEADVKKEINLVKIEEYKAGIEAYSAEVRALASVYELASTEQEREVRCQVAVLTANIEIAKAYLSQAIEQAKLRLGGTQAAAEVYKAICASALGTIHAQASISAGLSVGYDYRKSESMDNSFSESVTTSG